MAEFTVEFHGPECARHADELARLMAAGGGVATVTAETDKGVDPLAVVAVVAVVLAAIPAADVLRRWRQDTRRHGTTVVVRLPGGVKLTLEGADLDRLELELGRDEPARLRPPRRPKP